GVGPIATTVAPAIVPPATVPPAAMSPTIMATPSVTAGAVGNEARAAVRPDAGETCGGTRNGGGLGHGGAAEQQRARHGTGAHNSCGRAAWRYRRDHRRRSFQRFNFDA